MIRGIFALLISIAVLTIPEAEALPSLEAKPEEECSAMEILVNEEDLYWLSRLIYAESGADYCTDELQLAVGSVILNRVKSELYPDTIKEVIFDKHWSLQYGCVRNGMIYNKPNDRALENAEYLLVNGSMLPENVLGQSDRTTLSGKYCNIQGVIFSYYGEKPKGDGLLWN